jgi:hypothetical protein
MRSQLSLGLVVILLIGFIVIAFHHHQDDGDHPDCLICIAAQVAHSTGINTASLDIICDTSRLIAPDKVQLVASLYISLVHGRAPPA